MRKTLRTTAAAALAAGLVAAGATAASAHVTVTPSTTTADAYTVLTFSVPHGCEESSTTAVAIQVPEQIVAVTPTVNPGWDVEKVMEELAEPVDDGHGGEYTERVSEIVYTARTPLPHDHRDTFELSLKLPDAAGETLVFPAVQTCEEGESAWVQVPADGQSADELDLPAPSFEVTAASDGEAVADDVSAEGAEDVVPVSGEADAAAADDAGTPVVSWVALALGAAGLALGALALVRSRRTQG